MSDGPATRIETLDPREVSRLLEASEILLVDVREPDEFAAERIAGALLLPLSTFDAASAPQAAHMGGGVMAWKAAGLPVIAIDPATGKPH